MKYYTILKTRRGKTSPVSGTLDELKKYFGYTLEFYKEGLIDYSVRINGKVIGWIEKFYESGNSGPYYYRIDPLDGTKFYRKTFKEAKQAFNDYKKGII